jgi:lysophospholipase L1-like esterase
MRSVRLICILLALILCAGCSALPQEPAEPGTSAAASALSDTPEPIPELTVVLAESPSDELTPSLLPMPTPEPTPEPTPTPVPTPTPEPTPEPITQARLDSGEFDRFFDDALFLGDSLTDMFGGYVRKCRETEEGLLGEAQFFGVTSMSVKIACMDHASSGISFRYRGKAVSVTEIIRKTEAKRVFIMLGVNDIDSRAWDTVEEYFAKLIDVIHEKCPDTEVIIEGILPITEQYCRVRKQKIDRWNSFNAILAGICEAHGAAFLDFSADLMDPQGYLPMSLSSDREYHLNPEGESIWVRALRLYAAQQLHPDAEVLLSEN